MNKSHPLYQEDLQRILSLNGLQELRGKRFLITGATGLIGVCLIDALLAYSQLGGGIVVYAVGRSKEKAASRLGEYYDDSHFHFIEQDVRQPLPDDIVVQYSCQVEDDFHPRYAPCRKTYEYKILNRKMPDPTKRKDTFHYYYDLDVDKMNEAAADLRFEEAASFLWI